MHRRQRPGNSRVAADRMKLHRHHLRLAGRDHTVIALRPGTRARFSTNYFHETWHVLSSRHGAQVLARLLWGLSYQSRPGTLLLIDREFLVPTPFDADPADPIAIVPAWHTPFTARAARALKSSLPLTRPHGTVRWHTHGLDRLLAEGSWPGTSWERDDGDAVHLCGLLVLRPRTPTEARAWAAGAAHLDPTRHGDAHIYLDSGSGCRVTGEIQIFHRFHRKVGTARVARTQVLAGESPPADPAALREQIWSRAAHLTAPRRGT